MWLCCKEQLRLGSVKPLQQHSPVKLPSSSRMAPLPQKPQVQLAENGVPKIDFGQPAIADAQLWLQTKPVDGSQHEVPASASTTCSENKRDSFRWRTFRPCFGTQSELVGDMAPLEEDATGSPREKHLMQAREITEVHTEAAYKTPRQGHAAEASRRSVDTSPGQNPSTAVSPGSMQAEVSPGSARVSVETERESVESFPSEFGEESHNTAANRSNGVGPGTVLENVDEVPMHLPQQMGKRRNQITTLREPLYCHDPTVVNEVGLGLKAMTILDNS